MAGLSRTLIPRCPDGVSRADRTARRRGALNMSIDFHESAGVFTGTGRFGREWRITRTFTGWRLEFTDPGDTAPTFAGVHVTVTAAQTEANAPPSMRQHTR